MIIAFYGVPGGNTATTSNLAAIALMSHFQYQQTVLMVGLSEGHAGIEMAFEEGEREVKIAEEAGYFYHEGMDLVLQEAALGSLNVSVLKRAAKQILPGSVSMIPAARGSCEERVFQMLERVGPGFLDCLEEAADFVFLDCGKGEYPFMEEIKKKAGVLVVNLAQNQRILNQFFLKRLKHPEKRLYLTGHYEDLYPCNRDFILRHYRMIPENLMEISYHAGFREEIEHGRCLKFFLKNIPVPAYEKNRCFFREVQYATDRILRKGRFFG